MNLRMAPLPLLAALLAACGGDTTASPPEFAREAQSAPPPLPEDVATGLAEVAKPEAEAETNPSVLVETGELVSPVRSELASKLTGRVGKVYVDEGARVRKGQPLLELETDYLKLEVARAEAALARADSAADEARRDFKRKEGLLAKGSVSQAVYDRTKAALDQAEAMRAEAEAALALAKQRLSDAVLLSPIDGIVAERRTAVGERLGDSSVAFVIVQVRPLRVRFRLPERYLASAERGQIVRARVDPYPDEVFEGKVTSVVRAVDASTRTFVVEAEIPNRDERLKPGLFARVELDLAVPAP
ncbi:MAG TPA: efflux RND transporter periplasmic adaptor subunit [Vicinamibacteria bacterium]|nr:efflux RND transporter periplasmic adaptor subunit [Vicinamibacteria bacterium]